MSDIMVLPPITICDKSASKSDSTTLLGVEVDSTLSLKNHVKNTTKINAVSISCIIIYLFKIRRFLTEDVAVKTVYPIIPWSF